MRILLCEDDTDTTEYYTFLLQSLGIEVLVVHNGVDAVDKLALNSVDGVITDYHMPKANGASVSRYCESAGIRCLLVTSVAMAEVRPHLGPSTVTMDKVDFSQMLSDVQTQVQAQPLEASEAERRQLLHNLLNGVAEAP